MVLDFWSALIVICVTHPPVSLSRTGPWLILQEPFKLGRPSGISQQRGIQGEGREEGLGAYPGHGQSLRSLRQAVLLPRLLHLIYCLLKTLYLPRRIPGEWAAGFEYL